jgi:tRNA 2-thiouridine synthesizing protein A
MVSVLEALETPGRGERLEVLHDRRPMFLFPQLDERGFVHETEDVAPGMVRIRIWRGGGSR